MAKEELYDKKKNSFSSRLFLMDDTTCQTCQSLKLRQISLIKIFFAINRSGSTNSGCRNVKFNCH